MNIKTTSIVPLMSIVLYFARRLILAGSIVFMSGYPILQIFIQISSSVFTFIFIFAVKPYYSNNLYVFELYNEFTLLLISYMLIPLTMYDYTITM